jgi:hypothetical protein
MTAPATQTTPLRRFAVAAVSTCAGQASEYGQCIVRSYSDVQKNMCAKEFQSFKACMQKAVRSMLHDYTVHIFISNAVEAQVLVHPYQLSMLPGTRPSGGSGRGGRCGSRNVRCARGNTSNSGSKGRSNVNEAAARAVLVPVAASASPEPCVGTVGIFGGCSSRSSR